MQFFKLDLSHKTRYMTSKGLFRIYNNNNNNTVIIIITLLFATEAEKGNYNDLLYFVYEYIINNNTIIKKLVPWGTDGRLPLSGDFRSLIVE